MRWRLRTVWHWMAWPYLTMLAVVGVASAVPKPESVAVVYNANDSGSRKLALQYCDARGIPRGNMIGLPTTDVSQIRRDQYEKQIARPLRREFDKRGWWKREIKAGGVLQPVENQIRVLVLMRGVPLRIRQLEDEVPDPKDKKAKKKERLPVNLQNEASVDSELALLGVEPLEPNGPARNAYYQSKVGIEEAALPFLMLTARIDSPRLKTCERMIEDAVEVEQQGLWGMSYVDIANKVKTGDQWMEQIVKRNWEHGLPTVVDRFNPTLPTNYPMSDAAMYFGWYDSSVSGPFLNPEFRFRKGAVAMHLHSYSAVQLRDANMHWSGALLQRGAAVTIGNVNEPYLHMSHDFAILHQRLLEGHSWVEACWMAMPVASWQGVVLGDPLYRPFLRLDGSGAQRPDDQVYRAIRAARLKWTDDPSERARQTVTAASRMKSGVLLESVGLECVEGKDLEKARQMFLQAKALYPKPADKLRQDLHLIAIERGGKNKAATIAALRAAAREYADIAEVKAVKGWLDILDPPPPPPARPPQKKIR